MRRPGHANIIGTKWVFALKTDLEGRIQRYKARCTALGNLQREGVDYEEIFSPVVRVDTLRTLFAISASKQFHIHQMDVETAFLYGVMPDDQIVYLEVPYGYPIPEEFKDVKVEDLCCRVKKSIYGLKQSPRIWNKELSNTMKNLGFYQCTSDPCLFKKNHMYVAIFVDDLVIAGANLEEINAFKEALKSKYSMKDLGVIKLCLGLEISFKSDGSIGISQSKYIKSMLKRFGLESCNPVLTPLDPSVKLSKDMSPTSVKGMMKMEKLPYRELIGSLMYLMVCSRPDISFTVGQLASYMNCPGTQHYNAAIHLLKYIKGSMDRELIYKSDSKLQIEGYCDADWATNADNRRSTTGYVFYLSGAPITWKSKLQSTVALSSCEAEYMALTAAAQEAMYLRKLSLDFGLMIDKPTTIYEDNKSAIMMSNNPSMHKASKHIDLKYHFVREAIEANIIKLEYVETKKQKADGFTKALAISKFRAFKDMLFESN